MKKILKNNWLLIIIFLALLSIFLFNTYKYLSNAHQLEKSSIEASEKCSKNNITEAMLEYCEEVEKESILMEIKGNDMSWSFLIHSSDARVAGLQESEVEEELRDELREQQRQIEDMKITCQIQLEQQERR
mgnify:CR=1 FL=1